MSLCALCRHKLEDGNCATDVYVERRHSELLRDKEELKTALDKERKRGDEIRREAIKENSKLAQVALSDKQGMQEKILKEIEKLASKEVAVRQAPVLGQEGEDDKIDPHFFLYCLR